ncbi:hypothetical protein [Mucisphaera calidilacus]|uniref:non-reducing end alpha-L-arabinofuranosidase n=1 Tax=Mucisphaera calidilacus TaxID=2527982 RepID=A0A518BX09_9BACT|nr:hypothetical protein [Mucisphaera calidilacus]QDU71505.1 Intracellular exo-alpha-(1->5)-L-arabinofuranosidase [Mucisphaera calidilacus]
MNRNPIISPLLIIALTLLLTSVGCAQRVEFQVTDHTLNRIDPRLFGHFMEIASWGEPGPDAIADPETGELPNEIIEKLDLLNAPLVRFPGGGDIPYTDWTHRIDRAPPRGLPARPVVTPQDNPASQPLNNRFGYDEFFRLSEQLGWEPMLVVNLYDGVLGGVDLETAARHAAGQVAYCNTPLGQQLPQGMIDWPAIRAANGRHEPYRVKHWQIGNEIFVFLRRFFATDPSRAEIDAMGDRIADAVVVYADAMRAVDPDIRIILDHGMRDKDMARRVWSDPRVAQRVDRLTVHHYQPWRIRTLSTDGGATEVEAEDVGLIRLWYSWVTMPSFYDSEGQTLAIQPEKIAEIQKAGYGVVLTEWNWNGWGKGTEIDVPLCFLGRGLGAAGYLHGMMRQGGDIDFATQSMMLGVSWQLSGVFMDLETGKSWIHPTALATSLYSRNHGDRRLETRAVSEIPQVTQDLHVNKIRMQPSLALIDSVVTRDDENLYIHVINRSFDVALEVVWRLDGLVLRRGSAVLRRMVANEEPLAETDAAQILDDDVVVDHEDRFGDVVPARSVTVYVLPLEAD